MASHGIGTKRRREEKVKKTSQNYTYTYTSQKENTVLTKSSGYDALQGTKQEHRGKTTGKSKKKYKTSRQKVRSSRSSKQNKSKKGGK